MMLYARTQMSRKANENLARRSGLIVHRLHRGYAVLWASPLPPKE